MSDLIEMIRLVIADFEALHGPGSFQREAIGFAIVMSGFGIFSVAVAVIGERL